MTTFAILKSDVEAYYPHSDVTESLKNTFTVNAEAEIRRKVRVRAMETSETLTQSAQSTALPTGYISMRSVTYDAQNQRDLNYITPDRMRSSGLWDVSGGNPTAYTIEGENMVVAPWSASVDLHIVYYKMFDALSGDTDTNWLLTNAYDCYLWLVLKHYALWALDPEKALEYGALAEAVIDSVNRENRWGRFPVTSLVRQGHTSP